MQLWNNLRINDRRLDFEKASLNEELAQPRQHRRSLPQPLVS
jgi:hypothetical protein